MSRFILLFAALLLLVSGAQTQTPRQTDPKDEGQPPPKPTSPPPAEITKNGEIIISAGSMISLPKVNDVTEFIVSAEDIAVVWPNPKAAGQYFIIGKVAGTATLTLKKKDNTEQVYTIIVEAPRLQISKRLRPGFIAYSVDLPKENTVGSILGLNDYVVVFFTRSTDEEKKTIVLMKNIRVVAAPAGTVILEVTTEEAKLLKTSQESGTLALGLIADADLKDEKALQDRKGERGSAKKGQ